MAQRPRNECDIPPNGIVKRKGKFNTGIKALLFFKKASIRLKFIVFSCVQFVVVTFYAISISLWVGDLAFLTLLLSCFLV